MSMFKGEMRKAPGIRQRNKIMSIAVPLFLTTLLVACSGKPASKDGSQNMSPNLPTTASSESLLEKAKQEGKVVWYTSNTRPKATKVAEMFEAKYPGVKVEVFQAGGSQVLSKVEAEITAGGLKADVVDYSDGPAIIDQVKRAVFAKYIPENTDKVEAHMKDPNGYWISSGGFFTATIAYNTSKVNATEAPKSWKDLADPKWKGKVSMGSPDYAGTALATIQGWTQSLGGESYMKTLGDNNVQVLKSFGDTENSIISGETPIGVVLSFRTYEDQAGGKPIKLIEPSEGQFAMLTTMGINAKASNPYAARLFENFIFSEENQKSLADDFYYPARSDIKPTAALLQLNSIKLVWPDINKLSDPAYVGKMKQSFKANLKIQ